MAIGIPGGDEVIIPTGGFAKFLKSAIPNKLGPDDFGSYVIPASDPTFSTGSQYARSIAGGLPMEQVIAPGVSYSPDQPGGFTQAQLGPVIKNLPNIPPTPPDRPFSDAIPPVYDELPLNIIGGGRGDNINILQDEMGFPPPIDILGGFNFVPQIDQDVLRQGLRDEISALIPAQEQPDFSQFIKQEDIGGLLEAREPDLTKFITKQDIDALIPKGPTGGIFSIENIREDLNLPDFDQFAMKQDIPMMAEPDLSKFVTQKDINDAIAQINIPTIQQPDLSGFARLEDIPKFEQSDLTGLNDRLMQLEQGLLNLQTPQLPDGGNFSIERMTPGLFV